MPPSAPFFFFYFKDTVWNNKLAGCVIISLPFLIYLLLSQPPCCETCPVTSGMSVCFDLFCRLGCFLYARCALVSVCVMLPSLMLSMMRWWACLLIYLVGISCLDMALPPPQSLGLLISQICASSTPSSSRCILGIEMSFKMAH